MKSAFLITEFPSVAQTFVVEKVESLLQHGHEVTIFAWESNPPSVLHDVYRRINWRQRTQILGRIDHWSQPGKAVRLIGRAVGAFMRNPGECVGLIRRVLRTGSPEGRLRRLIHALPFVGRGLDLIHVQFTWGGHGAEDLGADLDLPVILSVYGADVSLAPGDENDRLYAASHRILAASGFLAGRVRARGVEPEKVFVLYNHIDCDLFTPAPDAAEAPFNPVPIILTVARLHWKKALQDGLYALAELRRRGMDFRYRLVGEGSDRAALEGAVADLGLGDCVEFVGTLERTGVRDAMRQADVFFLPSVREEFGCVLGEAQASGTPIVATRVGGIPEVVEDSVTGLLATARNPIDLADKLAAVLALPDCGRSMGLLGRDRVLRMFDRRALERELIAHYEAVVAPHAVADPTPAIRPASGRREGVVPRSEAFRM